MILAQRICRRAVIAARLAGVVAGLATAACGGGVSAPEPPTLSILPPAAVLYSGLPTTLSLSGGTGSYFATSSDQLVLPINGPVDGRTLTLVPGAVAAETTVTLTVRDTGGATPVSAALTVRPNAIANDIQVVPNPAQDKSCAPALCSGSEAEVRFSASLGGLPLPGRDVRFEAVSGSFGFVGAAGAVVPTVTASTDAAGVARARLRTQALVPTQTALLRATDASGGSYREASFAIASFTGDVPAFFSLPTAVTFTGPFRGRCAEGSAPEATVAVFGGVPPYSVVNGSAAIDVTPTGAGALARSGDTLRVRVGVSGVCASEVPVIVSDALGKTLTVKVSNVEGAGTAPPANISLSPASLALSCSFSAPGPTPSATDSVVVSSSIAVIGGGDTLYAATAHPRVQLVLANRVLTVTRLGGDPAGERYPATAEIVVADGTRRATAIATVPTFCP